MSRYINTDSTINGVQKIEKKIICSGCKYARIVCAQDGFSFRGCFCAPNRGKSTGEAKLDCPKLSKNEVKTKEE